MVYHPDSLVGRSHKARTEAVAYLRTSSAANSGGDKDSHHRQIGAIGAFAGRAGVEIVEVFCDVAVSGADPIESRPGFAKLLDRIENNGVRVVLVEDASRFARDLITQELGILSLLELGVTVLTATGDDLTVTDDPFKVAMRQIAGAFAQLEKARLVHKLKVARERKRSRGLKVEGRKSYAETVPETVALARSLAIRRGKRQSLSLRGISAWLAEAGHLNGKGRPYGAQAIKDMLHRKPRKARKGPLGPISSSTEGI
ncbi:recombinase family protein [Labrys okinawensis]|uniref:recombinase family protein n=1 Tax=Labrys okinawensis TaxID=346911 RepID=UPI0039BD8D28